MHNTVKALGKETIVYSIINIIVRGCAYFSFLLQTSVLTPSAYSIIIEFYNSYIPLGHVIYDLAMDMTYFRFVPRLGKPYTFNIIITILLISSVIFSGLLILCTPQIAKLTNHLAHIRYFYYMAGILMLDTLLMIPYAKLRLEKRTFWFLLVKFVQAFAGITFSVLFFYCPSSLRCIEYLIGSSFNVTLHLSSVDAVFMANLLSSLTALALLLPNFKGFHLVWHRRTMKMIGGYAATSFCTTLFFKINEILPLSLFRKLVPHNFYSTHTKEEILGNFGTSCKLTLFITLGILAFKYAAEPFFFAHSDRKEALSLYSQTMHLFILVSCCCLLLFSLNIDWVAKILIPHAGYRHTIDTVPYVAFAHIVLGVYYNFSAAFKLSNHPRYNTWISGLGSLVIWLTALLWIPKLGHWGCVYASISSATVMGLLGYYIGQKCYPIPYHKQGFVLLVFTFFALGKIALWRAKLAFLGIGWAYILLHITILTPFCIIAIAWYKSIQPKK
ncbi:lipopolysaccharide biosynthesis protein [Cardinium endosymbiont of Nabis limbatus]|uniref:lipopolysaccharide biosynthesis protein n=1 Tax=Cardinium endosymbiont of Nabis limbatus TaxID=3066217 RepID=UPI003AF3E68A